MIEFVLDGTYGVRGAFFSDDKDNLCVCLYSRYEVFDLSKSIAFSLAFVEACNSIPEDTRIVKHVDSKRDENGLTGVTIGFTPVGIGHYKRFFIELAMLDYRCERAEGFIGRLWDKASEFVNYNANDYTTGD